MTARARFHQDDVKRAMAGAKQSGFTRVRLAIDLMGNMIVDASNDPPLGPISVNPLDRILPAK